MGRAHDLETAGERRRPRLVSHLIVHGATPRPMPTTKPRYTVTDTGHPEELLDAAARRWPDVVDRKQLLLRLAEEGHRALTGAELALVARGRRDRAVRCLELRTPHERRLVEEQPTPLASSRQAHASSASSSS